MTIKEQIDIFWSAIRFYPKAYHDEYRRLYALMEKKAISQPRCYQQMQNMIFDPYYWSRSF